MPRAITHAAIALAGCAADSESVPPSGPQSTIPKELQCTGETDTLPCLDPSTPGALCGVDPGIPFVWPCGADFDSAAGDTATLGTPEIGKLCLSGGLSAGGQGARMLIKLAGRADLGRRVISTFDAQALGIAALRFKLDPLTGGRITVGINVVMRCECPDVGCHAGGGYALATPDGVGPRAFTEAGVITAPLADFVPYDLPESLPGTHPLSSVWLQLDSPDESLEYEFCVSEFELLDVAGRRILPAK